MLFAFNCGILAVFRFRVTLPLVPPPVRSVPAVTPVMVPEPAMVAHAQADPFHCSTWLVVAQGASDTVEVPALVEALMGAAPVTAETVLGKVCVVTKLMIPLLAMLSPVSAGLLLPEPKSRFRVPEGFVVLLSKGSACRTKDCVTALSVLL